MLILAFDTTSEYGGAALYRARPSANSATNLVRLARASHEGGRPDYSVWLFEHVDRMLAETGHSLAQVDLFAVANGPGSFTGVRVGLAAAQGWSQAFDRPVGSVSTLEALVEAAQPVTSWAIPLLDARRSEFYLAIYRKDGESVTGWQEIPFAHLDGSAQTERIEHGGLLRSTELGSFFSEVLRNVNAGHDANPTALDVTCVVREHDKAARALESQTEGRSMAEGDSSVGSQSGLRWHAASGSLVDAIARIGLRHFEQGRVDSPAGLQACYVRRSDAEMHWREDR